MDRNFADYECSVHIQLRRKVNYSGETLADVTLNEVQPIKDGDDLAVLTFLTNTIVDARDRARKATGLKQDFEANMRALEAGPAYDVEAEAGGFGE